jgi:catalase
MSLAEEAVDAINEVAGRHPGHRAAHAKGTIWSGTFTATPEAARLTRAVHMQGEPVRATVRFSNGGGHPGIPDYAKEGRGLAVKLYLPGGSKTDLVAVSLPVFLVRTPEDFVELNRLRKPDPETGQPDMERLGAWLGEHPEAGPAIQHTLGADPPASYAQVVYNGLHAFRWVNADGEGRFVRFGWEPEAGEATIPEDEAREGGADYLQEEIAHRIESGPVAFRLVVRLAEEGDPIDDPTAAWPDEREAVVVGRLEVTGPETERERGDDVLVFDPTRVTDGIELSDDPILNFRPKAYSVSIERRSGVPAPAGQPAS